jgi:hypothetical protein
MRRARLIAMTVGFAAVAPGCVPRATFSCETDADCATSAGDGACELNGYCSFADPACPEGRRFGDLSGPVAGLCLNGPCHDDADCDRIADADDNCPALANPGQENEDGDRFGDVCDPCPPLADDDPLDTDGDGVADACDPNPTVAGDRIALFEGFHHALDASWDTTGTWTAENGDAVVARPGDEPTLRPWLGIALPDATARETVTAAVTLGELGTTGGRHVGILTQKQASSEISITCMLYISGFVTPSPGLSIAEVTGTGGGGVTRLINEPYELTSGATYVLRLARDGGAYHCTADRAGAVQTAEATSTRELIDSFQVGFRTNDAGASYHWLMVVTSP